MIFFVVCCLRWKFGALQETSALGRGRLHEAAERGTSEHLLLSGAGQFYPPSVSFLPNSPDLTELITCIPLILRELIHRQERFLLLKETWLKLISCCSDIPDQGSGSVGAIYPQRECPVTGQNTRAFSLFYVLLSCLLADIKHCLTLQQLFSLEKILNCD